MNIVIPMVGRGTRTKDEYSLPKPLIMVDGQTIVEHSVKSLNIDGQYIFIVRKFSEYENGEELTRKLISILKNIKPKCKIIEIDYVTEGPASSALLAKEYINNEYPLIVTNCDQRTEWEPKDFLEVCNTCDACVVTYFRDDIVVGQKSPYSFVEIDSKTGFAINFKEKFAISTHALNGVHFWNKGSMFVSSAEEMIKENIRVNNEFYVSETFNFLLKTGATIKHYEMGKNTFFALGDSREIKTFKEAK